MVSRLGDSEGTAGAGAGTTAAIWGNGGYATAGGVWL